MKKIILFLASMFLLASTSLYADMDEAKYKAIKVASALKSKGYILKDAKGGYLSNKGYKTYSITLYRGNTYVFVGVGDHRVKDLDVKVYDENWNLVAKDVDTSAVSVVYISPKWTGTFHIKTKIYRGHGNWIQLSAWK